MNIYQSVRLGSLLRVLLFAAACKGCLGASCDLSPKEAVALKHYFAWSRVWDNNDYLTSSRIPIEFVRRGATVYFQVFGIVHTDIPAKIQSELVFDLGNVPPLREVDAWNVAFLPAMSLDQYLTRRATLSARSGQEVSLPTAGQGENSGRVVPLSPLGERREQLREQSRQMYPRCSEAPPREAPTPTGVKTSDICRTELVRDATDSWRPSPDSPLIRRIEAAVVREVAWSSYALLAGGKVYVNNFNVDDPLVFAALVPADGSATDYFMLGLNKNWACYVAGDHPIGGMDLNELTIKEYLHTPVQIYPETRR